MRRDRDVRLVAGLALCCVLASARPAVADTPAPAAVAASSTMVDVSDRFRVVAKRVLTKVVFARLKASCGKDQRCQSLVGALEELVPGLENKDAGALALAVGRFVTRYTFYLGIESARLQLPLEKLGSDPACQAAASAAGAELVACVPELYLGRASACSHDVVTKLIQSCGNSAIVQTVKKSAAATGWDLASGPRDAAQWSLLAIDVEDALYQAGSSTVLANVALTALHELTGTSRTYFEQGLAIRNNVKARLDNASGRSGTILFPDAALATLVRASVVSCAPSLVPALEDWDKQRTAFAAAVNGRHALPDTLRAPLERLRTARTTPSLVASGCQNAVLVQTLAAAADEALQAPVLWDLADVPPAVGLLLDLVNGRAPALSRQDALRWLILVAADRWAVTLDAPSCELLAARLWAGDVTALADTGCVPHPATGDRLDASVPARFFSQLAGGALGPGSALTAVGKGQYVLASTKQIDLTSAAQLVLRSWGQASSDPIAEALLLLARGDVEGAGARVLSQAGTRLFAAVRDQLERDQANLGEHVIVIDAVIQAAFEPLTEIFAGGDRQVILTNLANQALTHALEDQALNRTPLLVRVGLGGTWTRFEGAGNKVSLTVLDQFGLALKGGGVHELYVGLFAGGFIDALIRTQTDGSARNFWVTGATAGVTHFSETLPLGLELHAGGALPFTDLVHGPRSWMAGLSLLVPIDLVLDDD